MTAQGAEVTYELEVERAGWGEITDATTLGAETMHSLEVEREQDGMGMG